MTNQDAPGLQDVLAGGLRRIRDERSWSQDRIAERARLLGLPWKRATVADIEARRRDVSVEEFVLLPLVLDVDLRSLLPHEWIGLGSGRMATVGLFSILRGEKSDVEASELSTLAEREIAFAPTDPARARRVERIARRCLPDEALGRFRVENMAQREPEEHAAEVLDADPLDVVEESFRLWGRGLTEERDRRVDEAAGAGSLARRKGHVTRQLIKELAGELARKRTRKGRKK